MNGSARPGPVEANGETHRVDTAAARRRRACCSPRAAAASSAPRRKLKPKLAARPRVEPGQRGGQPATSSAAWSPTPAASTTSRSTSPPGRACRRRRPPTRTSRSQYLQSTPQNRLRAEHQHVHRREVRDHRHGRLLDGRRDPDRGARRTPPRTSRSWTTRLLRRPISNVYALVFNTAQDGFLGGYLAAGMTKTGKVATFGGQQFPTVTIYMDGFWDGVQYYNSKHGTNVQVLGWNETDPEGHVHRRLHQPDQGPDDHPDVHPAGCGHHLPRRGQRRPRRRRRCSADQQAARSTCSGSTPTAASAPRSTASTSSPA